MATPASDIAIEPSWREALADEFTAPYFTELRTKVRAAYQQDRIYPPPQQLFQAFDLCPLTAVKVVILGQDPYHGPGQANGLAFAVNPDTTIPPSLQNIYREIEADVGPVTNRSGDLTHWAKQGVLLLNTSLTVTHKQPGSHRDWGWERFTDAVIRIVNEQTTPCVFLLWGAHAGLKQSLITNPNHCILKAPHPSPLSAHRGFLGCRHFSQTNQFLQTHGYTPITW